ncbi:MAG: recombinase family protein [Tateyamaria sp.]
MEESYATALPCSSQVILTRPYDELSCLNAVMHKANELGLRSKLHRFKSGRVQGDNPFSRGHIYALLRNPIYIGKIRHKAKVWDGQHDAIIDIELWDRIQDKLQAASARPRSRSGSENSRTRNGTAPLTGKLRDETGDRLPPTHTRRHGRRLGAGSEVRRTLGDRP